MIILSNKLIEKYYDDFKAGYMSYVATNHDCEGMDKFIPTPATSFKRWCSGGYRNEPINPDDNLSSEFVQEVGYSIAEDDCENKFPDLYLNDSRRTK